MHDISNNDTNKNTVKMDAVTERAVVDRANDKKDDENPDNKKGKDINENINSEKDKDINENPDGKKSKSINENPDSEKGKGINENPDSEKGKRINENPDSKKSKSINENPDSEKGKGINENPDSEKGKDINENPDGKKSKSINENPDSEKGKGINENPDSENSKGINENPPEGRRLKWRRRFQMLLYTGGILCFLYFAFLFEYLGTVYLFQWIWIALGIFLIVLGLLLPRWSGFPRWFRTLWKVAVALGLSVFLVVEGLIVSGMMDQPQPGADYVIVLGAKVNGTTPSRALRYRIESAYDYIEENPEATVIASGGQGANEGISEALAISNTLIDMGVDEKRIVLEDESKSTAENLAFSKEKIEALGGDLNQSEVVVVSSGFHIFRSKAIARHFGYANVEGKSSKSVFWLEPNYCLREFFAIINDAVKGNLK